MPNSFQPRLSNAMICKRLEQVKDYTSKIADLEAKIRKVDLNTYKLVRSVIASPHVLATETFNQSWNILLTTVNTFNIDNLIVETTSTDNRFIYTSEIIHTSGKSYQVKLYVYNPLGIEATPDINVKILERYRIAT